MKVYIEYGWPEGKWHSRRLERILQDSGNVVVSTPQEADVVIAHSAGCYMIPKESKAKIVLLIGLPSWPNKAIHLSTLQKIRLEAKNGHWIAKTFFHCMYALRIPTTARTWRAFRNKSINVSKNAKVVLIHNKLDTYMEAAVCRQIAKDKNWEYLEAPGQHDDIWDNPDFYIRIASQELGRTKPVKAQGRCFTDANDIVVAQAINLSIK